MSDTSGPIGDVLFRGNVGRTNVQLHVTYQADKGITISGCDRDDAPHTVFHQAEQEYWRSVDPQHVESVFSALLKEYLLGEEPFSPPRLIELIVRRFGGTPDAEKDFRAWCDGHGIPHEFSSWSAS